MSSQRSTVLVLVGAMLLSMLLPEGHSASKELSLEVSALLEVLDHDDHFVVVEPGAVLCSWERFRLEVEVSVRSYVWVAQGRDGKASVIYPGLGSDPERLAPRVSHLIPDGAIELDDRRGVEQVFIVASRRMLARSEVTRLVEAALPGLLPLVNSPKQRVCTIAVTSLQGQFAPEGSHERYRDLVLRQGLKRHLAGDAALLRIPIVHQ